MKEMKPSQIRRLLKARDLLSVPEAGAICGLGKDAAYRAAAKGDLPAVRIGGRLIVSVGRLKQKLGLIEKERTA
jgi:hypothetical protein